MMLSTANKLQTNALRRLSTAAAAVAVSEGVPVRYKVCWLLWRNCCLCDVVSFFSSYWPTFSLSLSYTTMMDKRATWHPHRSPRWRHWVTASRSARWRGEFLSKCSKNVWILLDSLFLSCRVERYDGNCSIVGLCLLNIYSNVFVLRCDVGSIGKEVEGGGGIWLFEWPRNEPRHIVWSCAGNHSQLSSFLFFHYFYFHTLTFHFNKYIWNRKYSRHQTIHTNKLRASTLRHRTYLLPGLAIRQDRRRIGPPRLLSLRILRTRTPVNQPLILAHRPHLRIARCA